MKHVLTILAVEALDTAKDFYERAFGWHRTIEVPVYVEYALPGGARLGLYQRDGYATNTGEAPAMVPTGAIGPTELYFYPETPDALEAAIDRVESAGARRLSPLSPRPWGDEVAYFADPMGNVLALGRPIADDDAPNSRSGV